MSDYKDKNNSKDKKLSDAELESEKKEIEAVIEGCYRQVSTYSGHLSAIFRQLAFAEGALFWFSKTNFHASDLVLVIGFSILIFYFILDALQYFIGIIEYQNIAKIFLHDFMKNKIYHKENYQMEPPKYIDVFFYLKLITLVVVSIILIFSFVNGVSFNSAHLCCAGVNLGFCRC